MKNLRDLLFRAAALPDGDDDQARWALSLIVRLRFLHILFELALLYPAVRYGWMFSSDIPWYAGALAGLLAFNVMTGLWRKQGLHVGPALLLLQIAVDLTAMTILFSVSGGLTSPVHSLIHFQIGLAGIVLSPRGALAALAFGCGSLLLLAGSTQSLGDTYTWVGPLGPNLAYEWALAGAVSGLSVFAAHLNRHYRERLRVAQERIRQQDRLRAAGAVAAGFCHELASPLNAAGLLADRLQRKSVPAGSDALTEEWSELRDSLTRCDRIVRSMSGAPWDPRELGLQTADPGLLLRKIAREWTGSASIRLDARVAPGRPVTAPAVGLAQIMMTLLRNAEEASPGPEDIEVALEETTLGGREALNIIISDRGAGIPPEVRPDIGSPFNSSKGAGRGLGLFAAFHLTESLGGSLTLTAREGGGTHAVLTLPRAIDDREADT